MDTRQTARSSWLRALDALLAAALAACAVGMMFVFGAFIVGLSTGA
jgi:hypothetical protein